LSYTQKDIKVIPVPKDWEGLIEYLRKRPTMLIYSESIYCLAAFISGLTHSIFSGGSVECEFIMKDFEVWVAKKYNPSGLTHDSFMLTLKFESDEKDAFRLWFKWYDEYCDFHKPVS
jgi:hypothetical protein